MKLVSALLACGLCGEEIFVDGLPVRDKDDGNLSVVSGTLTGNWAMRWARSHMQPSAVLLECSCE